jgi:hypothetical protein
MSMFKFRSFLGHLSRLLKGDRCIFETRVKYIVLYMYDEVNYEAMSSARGKLTAPPSSDLSLNLLLQSNQCIVGLKGRRRGQKREEGGAPLEVPAGTYGQGEMSLTFARQESDHGGNGGEVEGGSD